MTHDLLPEPEPNNVPAGVLFVVDVLPKVALLCPVPAPNSVPAALCVDAPKVEPRISTYC